MIEKFLPVKLNKDEMKLALLVDNLDIHFSIETEEERDILQKIVYLAQEHDYYSGKMYDFVWYKNGVLSLDIEYVCRMLKSKLQDGIYDFVDVDPDIHDQKIINDLRYVINMKPHNVELHKWLKLVSSIKYMNERWKREGINESGRVFSYLRTLEGEKGNVVVDNYEYAKSLVVDEIFGCEWK